MKYLPLAARVCLAAIFISAGIQHLLNFSGFVETVGQMLPLAPLLAAATVIFQLLGAALVLLGYQVKVGAALLIVFLIPASLLFHNFIADPSQLNAFLKNLGLIGGLLLVIYTGPGAVSLGK